MPNKKTEKKFYVTTPIYYPNDIPHIGHAYTTIACDVLARWNRVLGKEVFFLTGTDEHGKKIESIAKEKGKTPKQFVEELIPKFKDAWKKLNINYDYFIRTTDAEHEKIVKEVLQKVYDKGDIYLGEYSGYYCTGCEAYYTEKDLVDGCCPVHKKKVELLKEKSYFFKLSKYQKKLLNLYKKHPEFILPANRQKEIINRVEEGLNDLSISRTSFDWGIKLPFDKEHIAYVWFDALLNYYSATRINKREKFWPADLHVIGKDIIWFHTVYWPAMLLSAGIELPKSIFAHGWWTLDNEKISKSRGKVINIDELISIAGVDSARYFLLRNTPFGDDGDFSEQALIDRHNNELADKLGNLVSRVGALIEKNGIEKTKNSLINKLDLKKIKKLFENYELDKVLNEIFAFVDVCNEYVQSKKPWETKDKKVLYELKESILKISELLSPFIPEASEKITKQFSAQNITKGEVLFKKI
jgi:methionyl-tRNA synthetase